MGRLYLVNRFRYIEIPRRSADLPMIPARYKRMAEAGASVTDTMER